MIQYSLKCANGHGFDSWFQSSDAFDKLLRAGHVVCAVCGNETVEKAIMAPSVRPSRDTTKPNSEEPHAKRQPGPLSAPASQAEKALTELRRYVEKNSEYVGMRFAEEARAIHDGSATERPIYGEARVDEAKKLIEDGVPVAPLPFPTGRKAN